MEMQVYIVIMICYPWLKKQRKAVWYVIGLIAVVCNVCFPFTKQFMPNMVYKLINVTFVPYAYIYLIGMYAYTFRGEIIPKLKKGFYCLLGGYIVWCLLNRSFLHFSFGHYCNIVTGVFVCVLTLSAGYFLGNHKFKKDYSYSIYLYHMIVINLLVVIGMKENLGALVITYVVTLLLSFVSTNYVAKGNQIMRKLLLK